jgi:CheY-like chemotaxis protein
MHRPTLVSPTPRPPQPVVAVVDDTEDHRTLARDMLEGAYRVDTYGDAAAALDAFAAGRVPDLVLLDIYMPRLGGKQVLARLRGDERLAAHFARVPVIAFSSLARAADLVTYRAAGFDGWIGKPVESPDEFRSRVATYLADARDTPARDTPAAGEVGHGVTAHGRAARATDDRIGAVGHDLRSALGAVTASLQLLRDRLPALGGRELHLLDMAGRNAERALHLADDLLDRERVGAALARDRGQGGDVPGPADRAATPPSAASSERVVTR